MALQNDFDGRVSVGFGGCRFVDLDSFFRAVFVSGRESAAGVARLVAGSLSSVLAGGNDLGANQIRLDRSAGGFGGGFGDLCCVGLARSGGRCGAARFSIDGRNFSNR